MNEKEIEQSLKEIVLNEDRSIKLVSLERTNKTSLFFSKSIDEYTATVHVEKYYSPEVKIKLQECDNFLMIKEDTEYVVFTRESFYRAMLLGLARECAQEVEA